MVRVRHAFVAGWPLVGRNEELGFVAELLTGRATGVVVAGTAGVGKTRFAREVVAEAEARGFATMWSTATDAASSIPFGAMAHLLPVPDPGGPPGFLQRATAAIVEQ